MHQADRRRILGADQVLKLGLSRGVRTHRQYEHFPYVDPRRAVHPLPEVLLLVVCGSIADCDDYEGIAEWGEAHLAFLRGFLPYHTGFRERAAEAAAGRRR
jgi:hypothetical protein